MSRYLLKRLSIQSLADRWVTTNCEFLRKLIEGFFDCLEILVQVSFKIPFFLSRSPYPFLYQFAPPITFKTDQFIGWCILPMRIYPFYLIFIIFCVLYNKVVDKNWICIFTCNMFHKYNIYLYFGPWPIFEIKESPTRKWFPKICQT